jgi:ribonuclease Z
MPLRQLQLDTTWGRLAVSGGARAGESTLILLPQLRLALDPGRAHRALTAMTTVVVSHGHTDHLGGLAYWASQRYLNSLGTGTVLAPVEVAPDLRRLLELHARLEGGHPYDVEIESVSDGAAHRLRAEMELHFFATDHWIPTLGSMLIWHKRRLRPDLAHLSGEKIAERRRAGEEVNLIDKVPLLAYCADSGPELFETHPEIMDCQILLLECSFFHAKDEKRAARYGHTHLNDLIRVAPKLGCHHLVLVHASRRHRLNEVEEILDSKLKPHLECAMHHLNVDWE